MDAEKIRSQQHYNGEADWLKWGPYLSERQWGTVREDYSANGDAWNYITHDMARSKAYRWGEEGIAGISDHCQELSVGLALWNGKDPILKERMFGLTNHEGNHGEDVKELYYYLDSTPTHSYLKMLYKYPQQAFPYQQLIEENARRGKHEPEFELIDTGLFDHDEYFDVFVEHAKQGPDDVLIRYTVHNRGLHDASIHLLPQLWFRNTWLNDQPASQLLFQGNNTILVRSAQLGHDNYCYADGTPHVLFTENDTNNQRLYGSANRTPYVKDAFNERVVHGNTEAVNPKNEGTKAAFWYQLNVPAKGSVTVKLRLCMGQQAKPFDGFDQLFDTRIAEADEFYASLHRKEATDDERLIQRQAWAGMLWSKQYYHYNVMEWLDGDAGEPQPPQNRRQGRNNHWRHFVAEDIISMPDKWEYPWFAAWDLAFHCIALAPVDAGFAKKQLQLLVGANFIHPNGQLPAYEWDLSDVNPPVHALATWKVYEIDRKATGKDDIQFLESIFQKLTMNFTWWVNRKDSEGNNIFEGGFLGLDNIGIFNRSAPVPGGGFLEQADGTSWMAMYALNMMRISMELALHNPVYESMAVKFAEHFLYIAGSLAHMGEDSLGLWDDEDGFYYDLLRHPDCSWDRLRLRTLVGLIPMFAVTIFDEAKWKNLPLLSQRLDWFMKQRPDLVNLVSRWKDTKGDQQHLFSLLRGHRMKLLLRRMLDPNEFLSDHGIRSVSKVYEQQPFRYWLGGEDLSVRYLPAESDSNMFGGNSNWRGPIWMPINYLLMMSLYWFHDYYTDDFKVEYPTGSGEYFSLAQIGDALGQRLKSIFLRNEKGQRPVFGGHPKLDHDEHFRDHILFHEYFNGDTGKGLGASHQTGWTGLIALII
ncbi:glucosidase [Mucilaginibacter daejeonensis]|uniref:MGH1-like glycoside hydrolase domain-containing protein n=1 Tax=Mucilaginibacter daejeonensis TaxID=398049 RepID=UPI001D174BC1|nr:glucosidase [Mucilaginibacter daejeonensis]UEG53602.1 glucosidase [Mucilaginibacter daejeonensis]